MNLEALVLTFLLNALWQVPVVVLAASLGERFLRRGPARLRHALWLAALASCVLLPAAGLIPEASPVLAQAPEIRFEIPAGDPQPVPVFPAPELPSAFSGVVTLLYGLFMTAGAFRLGRSWWKARILARTSSPVALSVEAEAIARRCCSAFGLEEIDLQISDRIPGPVTVGSVVLLPPAFLSESTADELTSALGHEMAHVRRRDYAFHLAGEALLVPVSFHPAVRRLRRRLAETREMACDEAVVERLIGARAYARSLLSVAASAAGLPRPALTLGVHDADTLEERMKRLTDPRSRLGSRLALAALSLALLVLAGTGLAASCLAVDAPPSADGSIWSPFLGVWRSPGNDLEIRMSQGRPEAILTLYGSGRTGTVDIPAYDLSVDGETLTFHIRTAIRYREGGRKEILEHTVELDITGMAGKDEARVNWLGSEHSADSSQIPPPPPSQTARRVRRF
ncbi:MAG TPA: M56 family metallopeptidase [Thermoanaerobaculia bacterium]|nr:M56 family metallopeptidase [Thermoanaerobaculia bacterium]